MKRSEVKPMPEYFDRYINQVKDVPLATALEESIADLENLDTNALGKIGNETYAAGKWTVKEVFQHVVDTERVFCFRALLVARYDHSVAPEYDVAFFTAKFQGKQQALKEHH